MTRFLCRASCGFRRRNDATFGWGAPFVLEIVVAAVVLYTLFLLTESRGADPIVPLSFFRNRVFTTTSLLTLLQGMVLLGLTICLPLFLQRVLDATATSTSSHARSRRRSF